MKRKIILLSYLFVLLISCKKDLNQSPQPIQSGNSISSTIRPEEILEWLNNNSQIKPADILINQAASAMIDGKQIVRIPVATNAALYFTKENGLLTTYAYKWQDQTVGVGKFTGKIDAFNFQNQTLFRLEYESQVLKKTSAISMGGTSLMGTDSKIRTQSVSTIIGRIWCWLTGGTWNTGDATQNDGNFGANGELMKVGCDYGSYEDQGDYDSGFYSIWISGGGSGGSGGSGGTGGSGGGGSGGGAAWGPSPCPPVVSLQVSSNNPIRVNVHAPTDPNGPPIPTNPNPTGPSPNSPNDPSIPGNITTPPSGCPISSTPGQWIAYPVYEVVLDSNISEIDDASNYTVGGYDNTTYPQYQQNTPWPTVNSIFGVGQFVPIVHKTDNCLTLALKQLSVLNYKASGYEAPNQTFKIYSKTGGGPNKDQAKLGVAYIIYALAHNIPVLIGVDCHPGSSNFDNYTDHYVVIVGMGTDSNGKYFRFFDSSTNNPSLGTSPGNKLYYNETTGSITGKTQSPYGHYPDYYDYIVTQIRKSK